MCLSNQFIAFYLSSFAFKAILLISSVKTLCLSLLNPCWVFNISLLFYTNSFSSSLRLSAWILFFSKSFTLFPIWGASKQFYILKFKFALYDTFFCLLLHCDQWLFQEFFYYDFYFLEILFNNLGLVFLGFKHIYKTKNKPVFFLCLFFTHCFIITVY